MFSLLKVVMLAFPLGVQPPSSSARPLVSMWLLSSAISVISATLTSSDVNNSWHSNQLQAAWF